MSPAIFIDVTPPEGVTCSDFLLIEETSLTHTPASSFLNDHSYVADVTAHVTDGGELLKVEVTSEDQDAVGYVRVEELTLPLHFVFLTTGVAAAQLVFFAPSSGNLSVRASVTARPDSSVTARVCRCPHPAPDPHLSLTVRQTSLDTVSVSALVRDDDSGLRSVMVALGTTRGGLQVQPWTAVGHSGHVSVDVHVQHASPVHATVVAENRAGLWSRFTSQALTFDRTPPKVTGVTLTLDYEGEGQVKAEARWDAEDAESGVDHCTCNLGETHEIHSICCYILLTMLSLLLAIVSLLVDPRPSSMQSVFQGWICQTGATCGSQTCCSTQSQYTDTASTL